MILHLQLKTFLKFFAIIFAMIPMVGFGQNYTNTVTIPYTGAAQTYTVGAGVYCLQVQVWGGGGAGGGNTGSADGAGGGGGGGYTFALIPVNPGDIINLSVGGGGQPVANATGGTGQNSWFVNSGANVAGGGTGGNPPVSGNGGSPGSGGLGTFTGGNGGTGKDNNSGFGGGGGSSAGTAANGVTGGNGASPDNGFGATAPTGGGNGGSGTATAGNPGSSPGGGGGGAGEGASGTGGAGGNGQIIVTPINICDTYCASSFTSGAAGRITNVNFNTINNPSAGAWVSPGYTNYTNSSCTQVTQGQTFTITVNLTLNGAYSHSVVVWFDWNGDGIFSASEQITIGTTAASGNVFTAVSIPCDAVPGKTVFRVVAQYTGTPASCGSATYGESEDYCVEVIAATPPIANAGTDQTISCISNATINASASTPAPANGYWSLVGGTGDITSSTSPITTVTGLSNGANVFQWTEVGTCSNSTDIVTINVSWLPNEPVSAGNDIFSCTQGLALGGSDPSPFTGQWVVSSGPNTPTFNPNINDPNAQVSGMINGTYVLQWQVNAGCGVITDNMSFTFGSLPAPNAGTDITTCPTGTPLNGNDFSGAIGTWTVFSGPAGSGFVDDNDPNTTIYGLVTGSYVLHWSVSGGGCPGGTFDPITITVNACTTAVSHSASSSQTFTGCQYTYTDNGGSGANYADGIAQTWTTFCPDDPNDFATITINTAAFAFGDYINIYDSPGSAAPIVASYYNDGGGGNPQVATPALGTIITSSTGCLYIQMNSTAATNNAGFTATIGCSPTQGVQNDDFITVNNCGGGGGITVCDSGPITAEAGTVTNPPDLGGANSGCLGSQEGSSNTWLYITAESDGWIAFRITPPGGQDYDYAIWGPYDGGYACPGSTLDDPLRCSWAANGGAGCPSTVGLGIINTASNPVAPGDISEGGTCSATNEGWTYPINATAGDVYVLLFQNYGSNSSTFGFAINDNTDLIPSGQSFATLGCAPAQPLPIELISFVGEHKDRVNKLYWNCASESHNDYFTIERSSDGQNWTVLATVKGAGFSQSLTHYSIIDPSPLAGTNYYRLSQTDFDGKKRKYKTIVISSEIEIEDMFSNVYPNPTQNSFYFNYGGKDFDSEIIVNVYNSIGQLVINESLSKFNSTQSMEIDTKELIDGFYQVEIIQNEKREIKKLLIVK